MRSASRPNFHSLSPDEQAQNDAEHQRGREIGFITGLLVPAAFFVIPVAIRGLQHFGWF